MNFFHTESKHKFIFFVLGRGGGGGGGRMGGGRWMDRRTGPNQMALSTSSNALKMVALFYFIVSEINILIKFR